MSKYDKYLKYFKSKLPRRSYVLQAGAGCVMVSAPHSAEQFRAGRIKYGEYQTGVLARFLHDETGCPVIFKTHNCHDDANHDEVSPYRDALAEYVRSNGVKYLIDIHQMSAERNELIEFGTGKGENISPDPAVVDKAAACFDKYGFSDICTDRHFPAVYPFTVSAVISRSCGICCLQIEINTKLVSHLYKDPKFNEVLSALAELISLLNKESESKLV